MGYNKIKRVKIIITVFIIAVCIFVIFAYYSSRMPKPLSFQNKIQHKLIWEKEFSEKITSYWDISQYGELICANNQSNIYFMNINSGNIIKKIFIDKKSYKTILIINKKNIYTIINNKLLYILDSRTGQMKKNIKNNKEMLYEDYVISYENYLIFLKDNGKTTVIDINNESTTNKQVLMPTSSIESFSLFNGNIYYSKNGYNVYAVELDKLNQLWSYDIGHNKATSKPILLDGKVYLQIDENIVIFNPYNGKIIDDFLIDVSEIYTDGKSLYANTPELLMKINKDTGDILWQLKSKVISFSFKYDENHIYFESAKQPLFIKIDKNTGSIIWKSDLRDFSFDIKKVSSTSKYDIIERNDGYIFILDKNTGEKLWRFNNTVDKENLGWKVYDNKLIIFDGLNKFYAYDLN
ncbi:MAG: hypothetical protein ACOC2W_04065 [bacterium]